jgi:hypothetical protein
MFDCGVTDFAGGGATAEPAAVPEVVDCGLLQATSTRPIPTETSLFMVNSSKRARAIASTGRANVTGFR